jgi:hypothetical protein
MTKSSGHRPGGGAHSKNVVRPGMKQGSPRQRVHVAGVAQRLGSKVGDHVTRGGDQGGDTNYRGEPIFGRSASSVPLGNERTGGTGAKGQGRNVHGCGSQGMQGSANPGSPMPKANSLWPGWEGKR